MHPSAFAAFAASAAFAFTASIPTAAAHTASATSTSATDVLPLLPPPLMHTPVSASASASATSASDRLPHSVNLFRTWNYYPIVPFPQSVTNSLMGTDDRGENDGRRRGKLKENFPLSYIKVHPLMASEK
jgi:hypothetical protein